MPLLSGPQFPHLLNRASGSYLKGNSFEVLNQCGPIGSGGEEAGKCPEWAVRVDHRGHSPFEVLTLWGLKIGPNCQVGKVPEESLLDSLPSRPVPPCGSVPFLEGWGGRWGRVGAAAPPSTMAEVLSFASHLWGVQQPSSLENIGGPQGSCWTH